MIFAGIDVNIITHEKALAAGVEALGLWTWGMCYAQLHETNGRLPRIAVLTALGGRRNVMLAARLVEAGLWNVGDDGSWHVHNYGKKNQSAEEIQAKKEASAARVRRWRERRNAPGNADVTPLERVRTSPPPEPPSPPDNTTRKQDLGTAVPSSPSVTPKARRKPETPCPDSDASREAVALWALTWKLPTEHAEFSHFLDHHRKNDTRWRDWAAAWRTWLKNAARFGRAGAPRGAEITKQGYDPDAPWMKLPEVG